MCCGRLVSDPHQAKSLEEGKFGLVGFPHSERQRETSFGGFTIYFLIVWDMHDAAP